MEEKKIRDEERQRQNEERARYLAEHPDAKKTPEEVLKDITNKTGDVIKKGAQETTDFFKKTTEQIKEKIGKGKDQPAATSEPV